MVGRIRVKAPKETMGKAGRELRRNRRIRNRTYGGVRGREPRGSLLLDPRVFGVLQKPIFQALCVEPEICII